MMTLKEQIEQKLADMDLDEAWLLIKQYEKKVSVNLDLISYYTIYYLSGQELDKALSYALEGVRRYPVNGDMYYNLASIYELRGEMVLAGENYKKAQFIYQYTEDEKAQTLGIEDKLADLLRLFAEQVEMCLQEGDTDYIFEIQKFMERMVFNFGLNISVYRKPEEVIGKYIWVSADERRYVGMQKPRYSPYVGEGNWDLIHSKGELLCVNEGQYTEVTGDKERYLLPIAVQNKDTAHVFFHGVEKHVVIQREDRHFNYYRVKNGTVVRSDGTSYYGKPIPLGHSGKRKKLVLNIFVDGLSQEILNGEDFQTVMPNTFRFFSKGTICTRAYSTAEWTYPSLANYVTGLDTPHHMLFHNQLENSLPEDVPTLAEYFQEMGYVTTKMDGDWRSEPSCGHARGYDRYLYHNQILGSKEEAMIGDTIEQLEGLKDADQFMWICMGDLHDVADGLDLSFAVQGNVELENRVMEDVGETSVKQSNSGIKIENYKKMASYTDVLLNTLYTYILNHYSEDEFIVSLFADHGQGYLVPEGGHFLSKERTKVAFMFRGGAPEQTSDEIISTSDYVTIMNHLAGIPMKEATTMGNLPVCFGGNREREYALAESIHPKDVYRAAFFARDYTVYFENGVLTGEDGRFALKDYTISVADVDGNLVNDEQISQEYLARVMEHVAPLLTDD